MGQLARQAAHPHPQTLQKASGLLGVWTGGGGAGEGRARATWSTAVSGSRCGAPPTHGPAHTAQSALPYGMQQPHMPRCMHACLPASSGLSMTSVFSCLNRLAVAAEMPSAAHVRALPGALSSPSAAGGAGGEMGQVSGRHISQPLPPSSCRHQPATHRTRQAHHALPQPHTLTHPAPPTRPQSSAAASPCPAPPPPASHGPGALPPGAPLPPARAAS